MSLDNLPDDVYNVWTSPPDDGYHFTTTLFVGSFELASLLDGGAVFSLTWESTIVAILNAALAQGMTPENPEWPLVALYRWGSDSKASSVAGDSDLSIRCVADLRLKLVGIDGSEVLQAFRFRVLRGGSGRGRLLILGAPALDVPPLGVGHRPTLDGHYLPGLGITLPRRESEMVRERLSQISAVFPCEAREAEDIQSAGERTQAVAGAPLCAAASRPGPPDEWARTGDA